MELVIRDGESIYDAITRVGYPIEQVVELIKNNNDIVFNVNGTKFINDFDYAVVRYRWSPVAGTDLDTRTAIVGTGTISDNDDVGYGVGGYVGNLSDPYIKWGGDNTTGGVESAMINIKKIKQDFPITTIGIRTRALWWQSGMTGNGIIALEFQTYKGGTMQHVPSAYDFINIGGHSSDVTIQEFTITANLSGSGTGGQDLRTIDYNAGATLDTSYTISGAKITYDETKKYSPDLTVIEKEEESNIKEITGLENQGIFDILAMTYGSPEYLIKLLQDSGKESISLNSVFNQSFIFDESLVDVAIYKNMIKNSIIYGTI